jgi:hypothetical protein
MTRTCEGCGTPLTGLDAFGKYPVCFDCVRARARTATTGQRCRCGRRKNPTTQTRPWLGRTETRQVCNRCLGAVTTWK